MARAEVGRRYRQPTGSIHSMRTMRMINGVRKLILDAALEEEKLELALHPRSGGRRFVETHQAWQEELAGHFRFLEIRGDQYASDIAQSLAREVVYYILHGDTPGGG